MRSANFLCQGFSIFARIMNMMCKCALFLAALLFFISSATTQKVLGIPNKQKWNFGECDHTPVACLHQKWKKEVDETWDFSFFKVDRTWDMLSKNMDKIWDIWKKSRYHENTRLCLDHHVSDSTFPLCSFSLIDFLTNRPNACSKQMSKSTKSFLEKRNRKIYFCARKK